MPLSWITLITVFVSLIRGFLQLLANNFMGSVRMRIKPQQTSEACVGIVNIGQTYPKNILQTRSPVECKHRHSNPCLMPRITYPGLNLSLSASMLTQGPPHRCPHFCEKGGETVYTLPTLAGLQKTLRSAAPQGPPYSWLPVARKHPHPSEHTALFSHLN